jgi:hypothetical protein
VKQDIAVSDADDILHYVNRYLDAWNVVGCDNINGYVGPDGSCKYLIGLSVEMKGFPQYKEILWVNWAPWYDEEDATQVRDEINRKVGHGNNENNC